MKSIVVVMVIAFSLCMAAPVCGESAVYINYAPDIRYSIDGQDSRISLQREKGLYGYGHDYGKLTPCADDVNSCIAFDYMALLRLPKNAAIGSSYVVGDYTFSVSKRMPLAIAGWETEVYRVDVLKEGRQSNSYFMSLQRGVLAIITPNFNNDIIPESIFFLRGHVGIFADVE